MTTLAEGLPPPRPARRAGRRVREWLPAAVVFGLGIVAWQWILPDLLHVERFLLPRFSAVMDTFWAQRGDLWSAGWFTFKEAFGGWIFGCAAGIAFALLLARWRPLGSALMPYAIAANAVPIVAFAPITNNWFGLLNPASKMVIAGVLCFFPVLVNTLRGLTSVEPASLELMRSYAATERETFRRVRIPTSLPYLFTALKVTTVLAMIGAIVGDYFGGSTEALGIQIREKVGISDYEYSWAAIIVASLVGIAFYAAVAIGERFVLSWHPAVRGRSE